MHNFIIRLIACFIPDGKTRRTFRAKHLHKTTKNRIRDLIDTQNALNKEILYIKDFLLNTTDITKIPPAHGTMRQIQMLNLSILLEIDRICRKYKLSYWLDFGTLLGAIRHGGFIPWDDDIDIGMPAPDYEKFLKIVDKELKGTCAVFKLVPSQIGKTLHRDFVPETPQQWSEFIFWKLKGKLAFATDIFPYYFSDSDTTEISQTLNKCCKLKTKLFNNFTKYDDFQDIENKIMPLQEKLVSNSGKYLFLGAEARVYQPHIYETKNVFPLKEVMFEGHKLFVPNNYNKILIETYGNYFNFPHDMHKHLSLNELDENELRKLNEMDY